MADLKPKTPLFSLPPVGTRVGAIRSADDDVVYLLGFGERIEDSVPAPEVLGPDAEVLREDNQPVPTIALDSGDTVWACECHWAPEASIRVWVGNRRIIHVSPRRGASKRNEHGDGSAS